MTCDVQPSDCIRVNPPLPPPHRQKSTQQNYNNIDHIQTLMRNNQLTQSFINSNNQNLPSIPTSSPLFYRDEQFRSSPMSPSLFLQPSERRESTASPFISNPPPLPPPPPPHLKSSALVNYSSTMSFSNISQQKPHIYQSQIIGNCIDSSVPSQMANLHSLTEVF